MSKQAHGSRMPDGQRTIEGLSLIRATFSHDRQYRYTLHRTWEADKGFVNFIGLNPSTADENVDDPTIRRCIRFARDWGYGGLVMTNLYAARTTIPSALGLEVDPVGPGNDAAIFHMAQASRLIVCAWGAWPGPDRARPVLTVRKFLAGLDLHVLGLTAHGSPRHPLYMPASSTPQPWTPT